VQIAQVPVLAGTLATLIFASSTVPMLVKARRTRDMASYSPGNIALANLGNLLYTVYVVSLPPGPVWGLHAFHTISTALMMFWYLRYVVFRRSRTPSATPADPKQDALTAM